MRNLITICGRGGSKGIKNKNIRKVKGVPLISYSIHCAIRFKEIFNADIALSTDSIDIKQVAHEHGLTEDYLRPQNLSTDEVGKLDVIEDLICHKEKESRQRYDLILDLDITSPLRTIEDLKEAYAIFLNNRWALNMFSVSKASRNPYFNMVEKISDGRCKLVKSGETFLTRQSAPTVFDLNASFYFYRRSFFDQTVKKTVSDRSTYYEVKHTCFDVDDEKDLGFLNYLLEHSLLGFEI